MTLASLLTVEGLSASAALITTIVALIKYVFPVIDARVSGALMAFAISGILYLLAGFSTGAGADLEAWFQVLVAWVACAALSVGIHSTVQHVQGNATGG